MEPQKEEIGQTLVEHLQHDSIDNSKTWSNTFSFDHDLFVGVAKSLCAKEIILMDQFEHSYTQLTPEGHSILQKGSPEVVLFKLVPSLEGGKRIAKNDLLPHFGGDDKALSIAMNQGMKLKVFKVDKEGTKQEPQVYLSRLVDVIEDLTQEQLRLVDQGKLDELPKEALENLKRRKLVIAGKEKIFSISKGPKFSLDWKSKPETDLTREMLLSGSWQSTEFRAYNFDALGVPPSGGHLHPLLKVRKEFREIFLELGYEEMPTNNFVESSFWNFDALFQPQSHPARDAHDTFFLSDPAETLVIPQDYLTRVKQMHEEGGKGSIGWRYKWQEVEARKNILRTHTTAISSRMLYKLAQQAVFTPKKYFSIDRVYRNETLDQTHLAEFHQIEGLVADYDLTLAHLIGAIKQFFERYGIRNIKFKPAYNPYTEPSMEIFGYHNGLKKWVEIGNSGMFRPEMLLPMGLPPNVRVIAWGLSLERPTMIKYHISNIRELLGHRVDINFIRNNAICRFEK